MPRIQNSFNKIYHSELKLKAKKKLMEEDLTPEAGESGEENKAAKLYAYAVSWIDHPVPSGQGFVENPISPQSHKITRSASTRPYFPIQGLTFPKESQMGAILPPPPK